MVEEPEHKGDGASAELPNEPHNYSDADRRAGWFIIGGFAFLLILLVAVELARHLASQGGGAVENAPPLRHFALATDSSRHQHRRLF
jgi:hypothetical protein